MLWLAMMWRFEVGHLRGHIGQIKGCGGHGDCLGVHICKIKPPGDCGSQGGCLPEALIQAYGWFKLWLESQLPRGSHLQNQVSRWLWQQSWVRIYKIEPYRWLWQQSQLSRGLHL